MTHDSTQFNKRVSVKKSGGKMAGDMHYFRPKPLIRSVIFVNVKQD